VVAGGDPSNFYSAAAVTSGLIWQRFSVPRRGFGIELRDPRQHLGPLATGDLAVEGVHVTQVRRGVAGDEQTVDHLVGGWRVGLGSFASQPTRP